MEYEALLASQQKEQDLRASFEHQIRVCVGSGCVSSGSKAVKTAFDAEVQNRDMASACRVKQVGCLGLCGSGPLVAVDKPEDDMTMFQSVTAQDAPRILDNIADSTALEDIHCSQDMPFFKQQVRVVRQHAGHVDPEVIEDYIAVGGYQALHKVLTQYTPEEVVAEMTTSGLRGRGGAGYPTGLKWSTVQKMPDPVKYVVCNGDEGDPGAFMDRSIMEDMPHVVLEGMAIAAYAVGASHGYIYVRAEYPLAIERLKNAIKQAKRHDLLGKNIFGTAFEFMVDIRLGAGAFVCGEETALMASIEGKRGLPQPRPPYPAQKGLWGHPTLLNNVETFANIAPIMREGGEWFAGIGTEKSKGTKIFALSGKINNIGLIEVPMGISLREIVMEIGGGIPDGRAFKAVQTGGPSGGCIPVDYLDTPVDYESLRALGSIMGSGGMIVMDETSSMVEVARYFMEFSMTESCGKCIPCRVGTAQMYDLLTKIGSGNAIPKDLAQLELLCEMVEATSLCGLGQSAPNPVVSTLRYFRNEYLALLRDPMMLGG